jgi:hypothetical protein
MAWTIGTSSCRSAANSACTDSVVMPASQSSIIGSVMRFQGPK